MKRTLRDLFTVSTALLLPLGCGANLPAPEEAHPSGIMGEPSSTKTAVDEGAAVDDRAPSEAEKDAPPSAESARSEPRRFDAKPETPSVSQPAPARKRDVLGSSSQGMGAGGVSVGRGAMGKLGRVGVGGGSGYGRALQAYEPTAMEAVAPRDGQFEGRESKISGIIQARQDALSTFAVDVDTAAYSIARRSLLGGSLPNPSLVRVEEAINFFHYDYEPPTGARHPFAIEVDGAQSPVDPETYILRVGLQARVVHDQERMPANLVFLVDTSCSMTSGDRLQWAKESMKIAVERLTGKDQVAITTYAGGVSVVLPPTRGSEKARILRAIEGLSTGGGTAMESGLTLAYRQAARMLGDGSIARIIVLSDGDANIGATSPDGMLAQVEGYVREGVTLSTIGFGDGNYKDATMETLANRGNGNYYYVDGIRQAERVFGRDLTKMIQDVAQDVKIQVEFDPAVVETYRLVGYENRDVADRDFRNDRVDAGEIGAGHQVTALYEVRLARRSEGDRLATIRVRAKEPRGREAKETELVVSRAAIERPFSSARADLRFATAVMGGAELLRRSPHAQGWTFARVLSLVSDLPAGDPDRAEFMALMRAAARLSGESNPVSMR